MNWFVWRQHRKQFLAFGVLLALFAALVIPTGIHFWSTYQHALSTCSQTGSCDSLQNTLFQGDGVILDTVVMVGFGLPLLLGLFLGSPLLTREYEDGTNKLVWTQSISRRKWLTAKLAWALGFAALYGLALTALITWWFKTDNLLNHGRFDQVHFGTEGLMPIVYSIFFTSVGFAIGAWFRKILVTMAITFGIFALFQGSFAVYIRENYETPKVLSTSVESGALPSGAIWVLDTRIVDKNGKDFNPLKPEDIPTKCKTLIQQAVATANSSKQSENACLDSLGYHVLVTYQPAYRYWDFQRIEAGIYLSMTALAVAGAYWCVLKRDA